MGRTTTLRLSRMGTAVQESATLRQAARVAELRATGREVFNFTVGEPDADTPLPVREAAHQAIDAGHTRYTASGGTSELRQKLAEVYADRHGLPWRPAQAIVSAGAKQVIWNALASAIEPGDEVVLIAPYWTSYPAYVHMLGGVPRVLRPPFARDYKACGDELRAVLGPRTRAILFNNPVNPTGAVYTEAELLDLFEPLRDADVLVVSDEIYERLVFEGEHLSPVQVYPELQDRFVFVSGASKSFAMTGWRIGFGLGPEPLVRAMISLQSHVTGNPNSVAQRATLAALALPETELEGMRRTLQERRDLCLELLRPLAELEFVRPRGTFYFLLDVQPFFGTWRDGTRITTSVALADYLLEKHGVAVVPGTAFDHAGGVRLSCTLPLPQMRRGVQILVDALRQRA